MDRDSNGPDNATRDRLGVGWRKLAPDYLTPHKRPRDPQSWNKFVEAVKAAAGRPGHMPSEVSLANIRARQGRESIVRIWEGPPAQRRCAARAKMTGKQCGKWALKGSDRCHWHGGIRDVPGHRAARRALGSGGLDDITRHKAAWRQAWRDPETKPHVREVSQIMLDEGVQREGWRVLEGCQARAAQDAGKSWRRWMRTLKAVAKDKQEQRQAKRDQSKQQDQEQW